MRDREPLKVRDIAGGVGGLAFLLVLVLTAKADWYPLVGFFAAAATAGGVHYVLVRL